jgi:F-type H+-transporting ATPase subunit b
MPQFDLASFSPQIIWLVITFVILYLLMARVALPRIGAVLETRQERITDDLDQADQLNKSVEVVMAEYEASLAKARGDAQAILAQKGAELAVEADKRGAEVADRLAGEANAAAQRIAAAKDAAIQEMTGFAVELAQAAAEKLTGASIPGEQAANAVAQTMREAN